MLATIQAAITSRSRFYATLDGTLAEEIMHLGQCIAQQLAQGGKLLTCGNGGSAAEAQHLAEELVGRFRRDRRPLAGLALTSDGTALTCIANDFGYDQVFARQVSALARPGDVVLAISTSGNSPNVLHALEAAHEVGAIAAGLIGRDGGSLRALCDYAVVIRDQRTEYIQEAHLMVVHLLCAIVEQQLGLADQL